MVSRAKADPFVQRRLLDVARIDQAVAAAEHRRRTLPELTVIADGAAAVERSRGALVRGQAEIGDLDRAARKLDNEIDTVRARAKRDSDRLASGIGQAKDLENMQHELASLSRRQTTLEDEALELMERREVADAEQARIEEDLTTARADVAAAERRRDDAFADIDDELARAAAERAGPDRRHAGPPDRPLRADPVPRPDRRRRPAGSRCEACRMDLDRSALNDIWAAGVDDVVRCTECGAILIRS